MHWEQAAACNYFPTDKTPRRGLLPILDILQLTLQRPGRASLINSEVSGCFPSAPWVRQPVKGVWQAGETQAWSFSPCQTSALGVRGEDYLLQGVGLVLDPEL